MVVNYALTDEPGADAGITRSDAAATVPSTIRSELSRCVLRKTSGRSPTGSASCLTGFVHRGGLLFRQCHQSYYVRAGHVSLSPGRCNGFFELLIVYAVSQCVHDAPLRGVGEEVVRGDPGLIRTRIYDVHHLPGT